MEERCLAAAFRLQQGAQAALNAVELDVVRFVVVSTVRRILEPRHTLRFSFAKMLSEVQERDLDFEAYGHFVPIYPSRCKCGWPDAVPQFGSSDFLPVVGHPPVTMVRWLFLKCFQILHSGTLRLTKGWYPQVMFCASVHTYVLGTQ